MKVSIIGAGFSGLTLAYYLANKSIEVEVLEAGAGPGGLIGTKHTKYGMVETAATSILLTPALEEMLAQINLTPLMANAKSKKKFILKNSKPRRLPLSFVGILSLIKGILKLVFKKHLYKPNPQETLLHWGSRVFSKEVTEALISPAMQGIYADSANNLSASLVLKKLFKKDVRNKSKGAINFNNGMGELIAKLETYLKDVGVSFKYGKKIDLNSLPANDIVLATSMVEAKKIINSIPALPNKDMTTATLFFKEASPIEGFGVLFPRSEGLNSHGVLLNSCMFEKRTPTGHSETWILSNQKKLSDQDILEKIKKDRKIVFNNSSTPVNYQITSWDDAFPIYGIELEQALQQKFKLPENIHLTGNYLGNLGLSGILNQNIDLAEKITKGYQ